MTNISKTTKCVIGINQVKRAVEAGNVVAVLVARDADARVLEPVLRACLSMGIVPDYVGTKNELGRQFGIAVGAAAVAVCDDAKS